MAPQHLAGLFLTAALIGAYPLHGAELSQPFTASSIFDQRYLPAYAVDGKRDTRWASRAGVTAPEWLQVDFGTVVPLAGLVIHWEHAYAVDYEVLVSDDASSWRSARQIHDGKGGESRLEGLEAAGRYLRVVCRKAGPFPLYSIWEIEATPPAVAQALATQRREAEERRLAAAAEARKRLTTYARDSGQHEIVFALRQPGVDGHWYANFGYYAADPRQKCYRAGGGRLSRLNLLTGEEQPILTTARGSIRDPQVHYDGQRILFSYLTDGSEHYHLYEINVDGTGLRQLTDGDCDDLEPSYLPDGGIVFGSSRCNRWVNCWLTPVAVLYRCESDGSNVRCLSSNIEHDNTPWVLPDGRVLYMRWEYVDRSQVDYHHLWTMDPDGSRQMVYYGNMHPGTAMLDAKPIPGSREVLAIFSPGHGQIEHKGQVTVVDPGNGPDDRSMARPVAAGTDYRDPFPLDQDHFLVATDTEIRLMDSQGESLPVFRLSDQDVAAGFWPHEPRLLAPRARERPIAPTARPAQATGRLVLANVCAGRNMAGVYPGEIRRLLLLEGLPKPINYTGGMDPLSYGGTFTLERVVGTVPVEPDGSAYFELPALRSFFFVALDEKEQSVKRMQSFLTVQPGEVTSCVGCHEPRTRTPPALSANLLALRRPPSRVTPIEGIPDVFDFPRDIQPILDRHCVRCHGYRRAAGAAAGVLGPRAGGVVLSGDRGPMYSHSYYALTIRGQLGDNRNRAESNRPPRSLGAAASPLMAKVLGGHHGVKLDPSEIRFVRYWLESGAAYPGTYAALGSGSIGGYYANQLVETDAKWPQAQSAADAIRRRCAACHQGAAILPLGLADERDVSFWRPDWNDPRLRLSRHAVFNLTRPEDSLMLLAPLATVAGGYGTCLAKTNDGADAPVFRSPEDPDFRAILALCTAGRQRLEDLKRFDMPGFRPPVAYLREMVRYGVLDSLPDPGRQTDAYALDQAYWRSLWYQPGTLATPADGSSPGQPLN